uniref:Uncharacterized protein n=1 Tax=Arundo donax TaxID=35708 RepID=A0A0A9C7Z8_ARUDO
MTQSLIESSLLCLQSLLSVPA